MRVRDKDLGINNMTDIPLFTENILEVEDGLIFTPSYGNMLCKYNLNDGKSYVVCVFDMEKPDAYKLFNAILEYDNYYYVVPCNAKSLYCVCKKNYHYEQIAIRNSTSSYNFGSSFIIDGQLVMLGINYPGIVAYNTDNGTIQYIDEWTKDFIALRGEGKAFFRRACLHSGVLYAPSYDTNLIMEYDFAERKYSFHRLNGTASGFMNCFLENGKIWLMSKDKFVLGNYDIKNRQYEEVYRCDDNDFSDVTVVENGKILCAPTKSKDIVLYDHRTKTASRLSNDEDSWFIISTYRNKRILVAVESGRGYEINQDELALVFTLDKSFKYAEIVNICAVEKKAIVEEQGFLLEDYIGAIRAL